MFLVIKIYTRENHDSITNSLITVMWKWGFKETEVQLSHTLFQFLTSILTPIDLHSLDPSILHQSISPSSGFISFPAELGHHGTSCQPFLSAPSASSTLCLLPCTPCQPPPPGSSSNPSSLLPRPRLPSTAGKNHTTLHINATATVFWSQMNSQHIFQPVLSQLPLTFPLRAILHTCTSSPHSERNKAVSCGLSHQTRKWWWTLWPGGPGLRWSKGGKHHLLLDQYPSWVP